MGFLAYQTNGHLLFPLSSSFKLDGVGPVDNRPSTVEAPPIGKIQPFSKIAVTH